MRFTVTYAVVTPESVEYGDYAEHGYASPGGWHDPIETVLGQPDGAYEMSLREAVGICGGPFIDCGSWFDVADSTENYHTGESTSYALHPPKNVTKASYRRLARLLGASA